MAFNPYLVSGKPIERLGNTPEYKSIPSVIPRKAPIRNLSHTFILSAYLMEKGISRQEENTLKVRL